MKTKSIPAIIMLLGGFCSCIIGIINHLETTTFVKTLLIVMIIFYILGCVVKAIIDKNFPTESEQTNDEIEKELESDGLDESEENIDSGGENEKTDK